MEDPLKDKEKKEVSAEEWENLKKEAKLLFEKLKELEGRFGGKRMTNFRHMVWNLFVTLPEEIDFVKSQGREGYDGIVKMEHECVKRYLRLLEKYPEFCEAETSTEEGMFPDLPADARKRLEEMERRLRRDK